MILYIAFVGSVATAKSTIDRSFVPASATMDRHLTDVAMTRHRDGVELYVDAQELGDRQAGTLVKHWRAPCIGREPWQPLRDAGDAEGERHTTWGVDLERAMAKAQPEIGSTLALAH